MAETAIEWTDKVWNPTTGCTRVSSGCKNCYAFALHDMRHAAHRAGKKLPPQYAKPFTELQMFEDRLGDPLSWRKSCKVFVNSMSDLFHDDVPDLFIQRVFGVMSLCGQHTFQILTKRPERMARWFAENTLCQCQAEWCVNGDEAAERTPTGKSRIRNTSAINGSYGPTVGDGNHWPLPNVWLGTSVEDQATADARVPHLLNVPAAVRFLSCEPLLGPLEFSDVSKRSDAVSQLGKKALTGIHWVIVGGESGPKARPFNVQWARGIVSQCKAAGVPAFVKQLGAKPYRLMCQAPNCRDDACREYLRLADKKGGDWAEWPADLRVREFPIPGVPA